jgi:hypothetical protein
MRSSGVQQLEGNDFLTLRTAHALEPAMAVIGAPDHNDAGVAIELLAAADKLRRQSGQGHARGKSAPGSETWTTTSPHPAVRRAPRTG